MGLAVDPNKQFKYILPDDKEKPVDEQRSLTFSFLTAQKESQVDDIFQEGNELNFRGQVAKYCEGISIPLVNWKGFKDEEGNEIPFDRNNLKNVLTRGEIVEVQQTLLLDMALGFLKRKSSASQSDSTTENSAKETETESV